MNRAIGDALILLHILCNKSRRWHLYNDITAVSTSDVNTYLCMFSTDPTSATKAKKKFFYITHVPPENDYFYDILFAPTTFVTCASVHTKAVTAILSYEEKKLSPRL